MSARELMRAQVLGRVKAQTLSLGDAAVLMGVGYRHAKRLWGRFRRGGAASLRHGHVGRGSNRAQPATVRKRVLALIRKKYSGDIATRFGELVQVDGRFHRWYEDRGPERCLGA